MMNLIEPILLLVLAFLPPAIYAIWIRNTEKYHREKWKSIAVSFTWGASIAVIASAILELLLGSSFAISVDDNNTVLLITAVGIAPVVEEFTKPLALHLKTVKKEIDEIEDGLIYGAVAGLGFSATENETITVIIALIYGIARIISGIAIMIKGFIDYSLKKTFLSPAALDSRTARLRTPERPFTERTAENVPALSMRS